MDSPLGIVLGSGLGSLVERLKITEEVDFVEAGLPASGVPGHQGKFLLGTLAGREIAVMCGRVHLYEGHAAPAVTRGVRWLAGRGVRNLILTNAAGGLDPDIPPGSWMVIEDHLNLTGTSPLEGGPAKHALDGFTLARGIVLRVRVETDRENLYFRVSDGYARYQRTTVREGRSGAARPGRIVDRDRGSGYVCEGGSSTTGSWLRCYDNGRLTYHSRYTVVRGNVSCTSRRY
jgi:hypothetical protein